MKLSIIIPVYNEIDCLNRFTKNLTDSFELMLNAGIDLFCLGNNLNYDPDFIPKSVSSMCQLVKSGKITEDRIRQSIDRIESLKKKYNIHG